MAPDVQPDFQSVAQSIDLNFFGQPGVITSYVMPTADGLAVVDPGPSSCLPALERGLADAGFGLTDVRHVLLTHVHLDHAGAAGTLAAHGATVYAHEKGAPHLARPQRLMESAGRIYGDQMDALWGEMRPVPREQLRAVSGGEQLHIGGLDLRVLYTPGHAVHHVTWRAGDELFCGDVAGVRLEQAMVPHAPTPPPDIDLEAWDVSLDRLVEERARVLHVAHSGSYTDVPEHLEALRQKMHLDAREALALMRSGLDGQELVDAFTVAIEGDVRPGLLPRFRMSGSPWMSLQGLARYWKRQEGLS